MSCLSPPGIASEITYEEVRWSLKWVVYAVMAANMDTSLSRDPESRPPSGHCHCHCVGILFAVVGVGLAVAGGWAGSDLVVYLSLAVVAATLSRIARQTILGACVILGASWLALILGDMLFGARGRSIDPRSFWIAGGFLTVSAAVLCFYGKMGWASLTASLVLAEAVTALVIVYTYGCPSIFQAFNDENRANVIHHLCVWFPTAEQCIIVPFWLAGISLGDFFRQHKKPSDSACN